MENEKKFTVGKDRYVSEGLVFTEIGIEKSYSIGKIVHPEILVIQEYRLNDNYSERPKKSAHELAQRIVTCVNMHDEMLKALKDALTILEASPLKFVAIIDGAKSAIKKAEQK